MVVLAVCNGLLRVIKTSSISDFSYNQIKRVPRFLQFMATPLLICDDSSMARKQVARSLPDSWDVDVTFATNGQEGLDAIRAGKGEMVFLDLTMPELDGYGVLEAVKTESLKAVIIVISGDIQPEARDRVKSLGALEFIKKPINKEKLQDVLLTYGLVEL